MLVVGHAGLVLGLAGTEGRGGAQLTGVDGGGGGTTGGRAEDERERRSRPGERAGVGAGEEAKRG